MMETDEWGRVVETTYVKQVAKVNENSTTGEFHVASSKTKTGIDSVDMEGLVIARALHRLKRGLAKQQPELAMECDLIAHTLDRMLLAVRSYAEMKESNIPEPADRFGIAASTSSSPQIFSTLQKPVEAQPQRESDIVAQGTPSFHQRQRIKAQKEVEKAEREAKLRQLKNDSMNGLWGSVMAVAASSGNGRYVLEIDLQSLERNRNRVQQEADSLGLSVLCSSLVSRAMPALVIRAIPCPAIPPESTFLSGDNSQLPAGIVRFLRETGIEISAIASSSWGKYNASALLNPNLPPFMTQSVESSTVSFDFGSTIISPTAYGFASVHAILPGCFPRSWKLTASLDGNSWVELSTHNDDRSFKGKTPFCVWPLTEIAAAVTDDSDDAIPQIFRYFKITNLSCNSFGSHELQVSSFEIYGTVVAVEPASRPKLEGTAKTIRSNVTFPRFAPLPEVSIPKKGKKK